MKKLHICMIAMLFLTAAVILTGSRIDWAAASAPENHAIVETVRMAELGSGTTTETAAAFIPDDSITRAQLLAMLVNCLYPVEAAAAEPGEYWYSSPVELAVRHNMTEASTLRASSAYMNAKISREEAAALIVRAARLQGETEESPIPGRLIADFADVGADYADDVRAACTMGLLVCYSDGTFHPRETLTRADAASVVYRLLDAESRKPVGPELPMENLMFLGDSLFANPERIDGTFSAHGHQVLAGNGASVPQFLGVSERQVSVGAESLGMMTGTLAGRSFNGIVILLGANDISYLTAEQAMDNYKLLLDELNACCDVPVLALKVYPVSTAYEAQYGESADSRNARSAELNRLLEEYCEATEGLYFIDATGAFTNGYGRLLHDSGDGLHISSAYYDLFYTEIETALRGSGVFLE